MNFIRSLNRDKLEFSNLVDNYEKQILNFSSISLKLYLLGQKFTVTWVVNTTIATSSLVSKVYDCSVDNL